MKFATSNTIKQDKHNTNSMHVISRCRYPKSICLAAFFVFASVLILSPALIFAGVKNAAFIRCNTYLMNYQSVDEFSDEPDNSPFLLYVVKSFPFLIKNDSTRLCIDFLKLENPNNLVDLSDSKFNFTNQNRYSIMRNMVFALRDSEDDPEENLFFWHQTQAILRVFPKKYMYEYYARSLAAAHYLPDDWEYIKGVYTNEIEGNCLQVALHAIDWSILTTASISSCSQLHNVIKTVALRNIIYNGGFEWDNKYQRSADDCCSGFIVNTDSLENIAQQIRYNSYSHGLKLIHPLDASYSVIRTERLPTLKSGEKYIWLIRANSTIGNPSISLECWNPTLEKIEREIMIQSSFIGKEVSINRYGYVVIPKNVMNCSIIIANPYPKSILTIDHILLSSY